MLLLFYLTFYFLYLSFWSRDFLVLRLVTTVLVHFELDDWDELLQDCTKRRGYLGVPIKLLYSFEKRITNDVCFYRLVSFSRFCLLSPSLCGCYINFFFIFSVGSPALLFYDSIYSSFCSFISICIRVWETTRLAHTTTENSVEKGNNSRTDGISIIYIS